MEPIDLVEFEDSYHVDFKRLSYEWLEKYVLVEPEDERILNNPREAVLDKGGRIFFARHGADIIGTVSLIKVDDTTFELAKLAVTGDYQGLGIGRRLMEHGLYVARKEKAERLILYTNRRLSSAIALYRKLGFVEVPLSNSKYVESDMKMELCL